MTEDTVICSNCKSKVSASEILCPECGMGLEPLEDDTGILDFSDIDAEEEDSLDDFLTSDDTEDSDDLFADLSTDDESSDDFGLDFGDIEDGEDEEEIKDFLGLDEQPDEPMDMAIPQFGEDSSSDMAIPQFDDGSSSDMAIPQFDDGGDFSPAIPSFDDSQMVSDTSPEMDTVQGIDAGKASLGKILRVHLMQFIYWTFIFTLVSFSSVKLLNPNIPFDAIRDTMVITTRDFYGNPAPAFGSIEVFPEIFIFGWITFLAMGWFARFRNEQLQLKPSILHSILFLILYSVFLYLYVIIGLGLNMGTVLSLYIVFTGISYTISLLTGGLLLYFVGYFVKYDSIFSWSPISKLKA